MTLILVSEMDQVKYLKRFARMLSPETERGNSCKQTGWRRPPPYLKESLPAAPAAPRSRAQQGSMGNYTEGYIGRTLRPSTGLGTSATATGAPPADQI